MNQLQAVALNEGLRYRNALLRFLLVAIFRQ